MVKLNKYFVSTVPIGRSEYKLVLMNYINKKNSVYNFLLTGGETQIKSDSRRQ